MAAPKKNSAVVTVRAKKTIALPPCTLGFASLADPDTYDPEKPVFKANAHFTPEGIDALKDTIAEKVYTADTIKKLREEAEANGFKISKDPQDPADWLEAKLKEPKETSKIQLPHLVISNAAQFMRRGEVVKREISCWDHSNGVLDLKKLKLGMGSLVQLIVFPNLFFSKIIGVPQPSLKLVGVRVLQLKRFGGSMAPADTDDEAIKEVLGETFEYDDLSAYMQGAAGHPEEEPQVDPDDLAKGMF